MLKLEHSTFVSDTLGTNLPSPVKIYMVFFPLVNAREPKNAEFSTKALVQP